MAKTFVPLFIPITLLHLTLVTSSPDFWIRRHLGNGKLYEFNGTDLSPDNIHRVDIEIRATTARKDSASHPLHAIRVSWSPARNAAAYRVHCEANTTDDVVTIFDKELFTDFTKIDERFVLPRGRLSVICCVAAANKYGASLWTYSPMLTINPSNMEWSSDNCNTGSEKSSITSEDLTADQLLKLIHKSDAVDLPTKPIQRPPEERIVIRPKYNTLSSFSEYEKPRPHENLMNFDVDVKDIARDYETLEKDIRESIGATDDTSRTKSPISEHMLSILNRVWSYSRELSFSFNTLAAVCTSRTDVEVVRLCPPSADYSIKGYHRIS